MTTEQIRAKAYRKARNYMATHGKQVMYMLMSNSEKVLFMYVRKVNEQIFSKA